MPKAAVHKDDKMLMRKYEVRLSKDGFIAKPPGYSVSTEDSNQLQLGTRTPGPNSRRPSQHLLRMNRKFFSSLTGTVNRETGVISGVSVATIGEAKGHGVKIDQTTLSQIKAAADKAGSVRVGIDHWSGFGGIAGSLREFRIEGDHLRADLHLLQNHPARERILEMSEKMPAAFGLSIAYVGTEEDVNGTAFARITELLSVDLVDTPAANPTGLFGSPTPELVEMRRRHLAELETLRTASHRIEMQVLEQEAAITQLRREKEALEKKCHSFTHEMELLASRRAAEIVASTGTSAPAPISPGRFEEEFAQLRGMDLAKAANKNRQP